MINNILFISMCTVLSSAYAETLENALKRIHLDPTYQSHFCEPNTLRQVAVIDTGYDRGHQELQTYLDKDHGIYPHKKTTVCENFTQSVLLNESFIVDPTHKHHGQQSSHGTHVIGIAAAAYGDIQSLTQSGHFKPVVPVKISVNHTDTENFITALTTLKDNQNVCVINLSWSFGGTKGNQALNPKLEKAMLETMESGKIIVLAAGNDKALYNTNTYTKSIFELAKKANGRLIVVGASEEKDGKERMASFSAISDPVMAPYFLTAPGANIESFIPVSHALDGKGEKSGTSMAAPLVSGAIARIATDFPQLSIDQISHIVRQTARKQYRDNGTVYNRFGCGIVDIEAARKMAETEVLKMHIAKTSSLETAPLKAPPQSQAQKIELSKEISNTKTSPIQAPYPPQKKETWSDYLWKGISQTAHKAKSGLTSAMSYLKSTFWG